MEDKWVIQYKVEWINSWLTDSIADNEINALRRASDLNKFDHDDVRIIKTRWEYYYR